MVVWTRASAGSAAPIAFLVAGLAILPTTAHAQSTFLPRERPSEAPPNLTNELRDADLGTVRVERSGTAASFNGEDRREDDAPEADAPPDAQAATGEPAQESDAASGVADFDLFAGPEEPASAFQTRAESIPAAGPIDARLAAEIEALAAEAEADRLDGRLNLPIGAAETTQPDLAGGRLNLPGAGLANSLPRIGDDPFAALGLRVGRFTLYPTLEQSLGYSSNLDRIPDGEGGTFSETTLSGRLVSDWLIHEAEINASGTYRRNFAGETPEDPRLFADGRLRLDIDRDTTATLRGSFSFQREDPLELDDLADFSERPDVLNSAASLEVERRFGRTLLGVTAAAARESYRDREASFEDGDYSTLTAGLRAGYEISPAIRPFVEGSAGRRLFDDDVDAAGLERHSLITAIRTGVALDFGEKISGEAAVGYAWNTPDDGALPVTRSPTFDALVAWSPRRGTDVALAAATRFEPETSNLSTTTVFEASLGITHELTARTELNAQVSAGFSDSDIAGDDDTFYAGEAGFTYWLNRSLALTGLVDHERTLNETGDDDYSATSIRVGVRLQR